MPRYFNLFKCGVNILNRIDVTYERVCMATSKYKYYTNMLETLVDYNDRQNFPLYNDMLPRYISTFMVDTEEEEHNII